MTTRWSIARLISLAGLLATTLSSGAAKPANNIPVTVTIADAANAYPFRVASDLKGGYVHTTQVTSLIVGTTGDWTLTTYYSGKGKGNSYLPSNRSVFFDLSEPVSPSNPTPPLTVGYQQSHLMAKCSQVGVQFLQIPVGTTVQCPGTFRFQAPSGLWYRLGFQPENYPEVNRMAVSCSSADAGGCKAWTIQPSGTTLTGTDPNPKNVNKLLQIDPGSEAVLADLGDYYISFAITIAR